MRAPEGSAVTDLQLTAKSKVVALLAIRHKLLTCKILVLNASNGDLIAEQSFVDVLKMNVVFNRHENTCVRTLWTSLNCIIQGLGPTQQPDGRLQASLI